MYNWFGLFLTIFLSMKLQIQPMQPAILLEFNTPIGGCMAYWPDLEEMQKTADLAKAIFIEAFSTTYKQYYLSSGSVEPIEKWLRLREGLTLEKWLDNTFDDEFQEYLLGLKSFVYLRDSKNNLIGWLSHSLISEKGDLYLSQCSLEADSRNQKVATAVFVELFKNGCIKALFPEAKEVKLIARKINTIAGHLYLKAGFYKDETIDPSLYGESYDDRYVGYRSAL